MVVGMIRSGFIYIGIRGTLYPLPNQIWKNEIADRYKQFQVMNLS